MSRRSAPLGVLFVAVTTVALAQQAPTFRTTVEIVQLQVSVTDSRGHVVPGLRAEDFELLIDGSARPVHTVYEVDVPVPGASDADGVVASTLAGSDLGYARLPVSARRHFLLLFDLRFTDFVGARLARDAAARFVDEALNPSDLVALAIIGSNGVELVQPFVGDHRYVAASVGAIRNRFASEQAQVTGAEVRAMLQELGGQDRDGFSASGELAFLATEQDAAYQADVDAYLRQLRDLAQMLQAVRGRKHVVMFTTGFSDAALFGSMGNNAYDRGDAGSLVNELYGVGAAFRAADAVLYPVNTERLRGFASNDPSVFRANSQQAVGTTSHNDGRNTGTRVAGRSRDNLNSLTALAELSGGEWFANLTDFGGVLRKIEESSRSYYVIAYRRAADDPAAVAVQVKVRDARADMVVAPERVAPPPPYPNMTPQQRALQLAEVLAEPLDNGGDIQLSVLPVPGGAAGVARFVGTIPGEELGRLAGQRGDDSIEIELGVFALDGPRVHDAIFRGIAGRFDGVERGLLVSDVLQAPDAGELRLLLRDFAVGQPRHLRQRYRVSSSDRQDPRLLGPVLVGVYPTADGSTPLLQAGQAIELWQAGADFNVTTGWGVVELQALLGLEDAAGTRFQLPVTPTRQRNEGPYEERWLQTTLPAGAAPGPATLTLWVRSSGSEEVFSRALAVTIENATAQ